MVFLGFIWFLLVCFKNPIDLVVFCSKGPFSIFALKFQKPVLPLGERLRLYFQSPQWFNLSRKHAVFCDSLHL